MKKLHLRGWRGESLSYLSQILMVAMKLKGTARYDWSVRMCRDLIALPISMAWISPVISYVLSSESGSPWLRPSLMSEQQTVTFSEYFASVLPRNKITNKRSQLAMLNPVKLGQFARRCSKLWQRRLRNAIWRNLYRNCKHLTLACYINFAVFFCHEYRPFHDDCFICRKLQISLDCI